MFVKCSCEQCNGHIEFDEAYAGLTIVCPHCGSETKLFIPGGPLPPPKIKPEASQDNTNAELRPTLSFTRLETKPPAAPIIQKPEIPPPAVRPQSGEPAYEANVSKAKAVRLTLTTKQCLLPEVQELIDLLIDITQAGLVTEEGLRRLNAWLNQKADSDIPAIQFLLTTSDQILRTGKLITAQLFEMHFAIERVLPKNIRMPIRAKRQEAWLHSPSKPKATQAQLDYIRGLGGNPPADLNISEASLLIEKLLEAPDVEEKKQAAREQRRREAAEREQWPAYYLHQDYEQAKRGVEIAERGEVKDAEMYLNDAKNARLEFWQDTFDSPCNMQGLVTEQSVRLYLEHGHRFKKPSEKRILAILDGLDAQSPAWDKNGTVSFYLTLEASFPELLRTEIDYKALEMDKEWLDFQFR